MLKIEFPMLQLKNRRLLPIVQGGMGVGISARRLAGAVAKEGAVGTIASVDLRHHHPDLLAQAGKSRDRETLDRLNLVALDREVRGALEIAQGNGVVAVNVMRAVSAYADHVRQSCESGAHAIVMGAGLPLELPELTSGYPEVALVPILSDARGVSVVLRKWMRKNRLPDAIIIEHPGHAGGHLGAAKPADIGDARFEFEVVLPEVLRVLSELGVEKERIPLIAAGGVNSHQKVKNLISMGATAVQVGTAFAVTHESDAHPNFKKVLAEAKKEDIVTFMSVAGLPARGVMTPWLKSYLKREVWLQSRARADLKRCVAGLQCLSVCGWRDGLAKIGQFCIDNQLAAALRGEIGKGLFFRGADALPFGSAIRSAGELIEYLLTGTDPEPAPSV